jgi:multicomponent Na+:H+ antiporter subunit B
MMRWLYVIAIAAIFVRLAFLLPAGDVVVPQIAEAIVAEAEVPNAVSGLLLRNRLYDTLFELLVFMSAVLGVQYTFSMYKSDEHLFYMNDPNIIILARIGAMVSGLIFLELALRGHLAPGGGFAAGVAGGTAAGLLMLTGGANKMQDVYRKWKIASVEKGLVLIAFLVGIPFIMLSRAPDSGHGYSAIIIPVLNTLIAFKVAFGSWTIIQLFIRQREEH